MIDLLSHELADFVRRDFVKDLYIPVSENTPTGVYRVKYKGKIVEQKGVFIVIPAEKVILTIRKFGQNYHVIRDESKENLPARLAHLDSFSNASFLIIFILQMIKRATQQNKIKEIICKMTKIQCVPLKQFNVILGRQFGPERPDIGIRQFERGYRIAVAGKIKAVFTCAGANIQYFCRRRQIFFDLANGVRNSTLDAFE